jgi:hypothetical protein
MVVTMVLASILFGLCIVARSSSLSIVAQSMPTWSLAMTSARSNGSQAFPLILQGVAVDRYEEFDFDTPKRRGRKGLRDLFRPVATVVKRSFPWSSHRKQHNTIADAPSSGDNCKVVVDQTDLAPRGGDIATVVNAAAAPPMASSIVEAPTADTANSGLDYSDDESTYIWRRNSRTMYDHSIETIPRMFRDKSRRKILKGLTMLYEGKGVVVVDEEALYHVVRDVTPSFILSKSIAILDQYRSK